MSNYVRVLWVGCALFGSSSFADMMTDVGAYVRSGVSDSEVAYIDLPPYVIPANKKRKDATTVEVPQPPMKHIPLKGRANYADEHSPECEVDVAFISGLGDTLGFKIRGGREGSQDKALEPYSWDLKFSDDGVKRMRIFKEVYFEALDENSKGAIYRVSISKFESGRISKISIGHVLHPDPEMMKVPDRVCEFSPPVEALKATAEMLVLPPPAAEMKSTPAPKSVPAKPATQPTPSSSKKRVIRRHKY